HVKNTIAQPEHARHVSAEPVSNQKGVVTQPSPPDALRENVFRLLLAFQRLQLDLEYTLLSYSSFVGRRAPQTTVELISAATCDYRYAGEISEIFGQSELRHLWVQQLTLVPLLGWQRDDIVRRNCLKPVSNRRMGRHEEFHIARRKSGLVSDIVS